MSLPRNLLFIFIVSALSQQSFAAGAEEERLSGFAKHQSNNKQFDKARAQGERAFLEEVEQWESQRQRQAEAYRKTKKVGQMPDDGPEANADAADKKKIATQYEQTRRQYVEQKLKTEETLSREAKHLPSEAQELGIDSLRPRYDYKKRSLYGAKPKYGAEKGNLSSAGSGSSSGGSGSFPPPPSFDDFSGSSGNGYVPAPNLPQDFGDIPPPPPPPPPPAFGDDFGGGYGTDFIPPAPQAPPFGVDGPGDF